MNLVGVWTELQIHTVADRWLSFQKKKKGANTKANKGEIVAKKAEAIS